MDLHPLHLRITLARVEINLQIRNLQKFKIFQAHETRVSFLIIQISDLTPVKHRTSLKQTRWNWFGKVSDMESWTRNFVWEMIICRMEGLTGWSKKKVCRKGWRRRIFFCGRTKGSAKDSTRGPRGPKRKDCHEKITSPKFDRPEYFDDQETLSLYWAIPDSWKEVPCSLLPPFPEAICVMVSYRASYGEKNVLEFFNFLSSLSSPSPCSTALSPEEDNLIKKRWETWLHDCQCCP